MEECNQAGLDPRQKFRKGLESSFFRSGEEMRTDYFHSHFICLCSKRFHSHFVREGCVDESVK